MTPRPSGTWAMPLVTIASTGARVMSSPSSRTWPRLQRTRPLMVRSSVVFPAPLAPRTAVMRPVSARRETPSSARTGPYDDVRSRTSRTAVPSEADNAVLPVACGSATGDPLRRRRFVGGARRLHPIAEVGTGDRGVRLDLGRRPRGDQPPGVQHRDPVADPHD